MSEPRAADVAAPADRAAKAEHAAPSGPAAESAPAAERPRVLAVIPAHNEASRIESVVARALMQLPVLVVDDGSTDDTAARAEAVGAKVLVQQPNQGKGAALRAGFGRAVDDGYDAIVTLDGDGQHDPAEIGRFVDAWLEGRPDLVIGRRNFRRMPPIRRLANLAGAAMFSWAVGEQIPDNQSGYRLLSRRLAEAMLNSREPGFAFEVDMITTAIRAGWQITWVPISTLYLGGPSHIRPVAHMREFLRMSFDARAAVRGAERTGS